MNLRECIENGARGFVELDRAAHVERAVQRLLGPFELAESHTDLAQGRQGDRQPMPGSLGFVERDASLGYRQRLFVTVLDHRDIRLVATDRGDDVVGVNERSQPIGMAERAHRVVEAARVGQGDAGHIVHEGQTAPVAGRVQCGCRLGDVLADDGDIADLPIALRELVVRETDEPGVVRELRMFERAPVHGDGARLIAARRGEPTVEPLERRDATG